MGCGASAQPASQDAPPAAAAAANPEPAAPAAPAEGAAEAKTSGAADGAADGAAGDAADGGIAAVVDTLGAVAGTAIGAAGTVAGTAVGAAGTVAGTAVGAAGAVAGTAVGAAGTVAGTVMKVPKHLDGLFTGDSKLSNATLGVMRLDYHYPPAPGDVDHPGSYDYDVFYRMVPGLSFETCQSGQLTPEIEKETIKALLELKCKGVSVITGDCGFMMWLQQLARRTVALPVVMSSLASLPSIKSAYSVSEKIAIFTANGKTLEPMRDLIKFECGVDPDENRFVIVGCEDVPGFEAVAAGDKVDVASVTPGMVQKAKDVLAAHPDVKAILMECTELPPYSDALRKATGLPVFDAITMCDFFISGRLDNPRFGCTEWEHVEEDKGALAQVGEHLTAAGSLLMKPVSMAADVAMTAMLASKQRAMSIMARAKASGAKLGVVRLDYDYPPAVGDIDHPNSYAYEVHYHIVKGLTFEMCQKGVMTTEVEERFVEAIRELEKLGVSVITGDCGFMMWFQTLARQNTSLPVVMSSLASLGAMVTAHSASEKIAVFTANGKTLEPMRDLIKEECGVDPEQSRFVIVGCEDVPGFEAVALGEKVDVAQVTPGMVKKAQDVLAAHPDIKSILMECTELPPYSDALRHATGLPVFDAITTCDFFITSRMDNPKFGVDEERLNASTNWLPPMPVDVSALVAT